MHSLIPFILIAMGWEYLPVHTLGALPWGASTEKEADDYSSYTHYTILLHGQVWNNAIRTQKS